MALETAHSPSAGGEDRRGGKVLILTQPLGGNYGGALQAYALQRVLSSLGMRPLTNNSLRPRSGIRRRLGMFRSRFANRLDSPEHAAIEAELRAFVRERIATVDLFVGRQRPPKRALDGFEAIVVGSDQVWRAAYSDIPRHLLDFAPDRVRKVSYAASFGTSDLEGYDEDLVRQAADLAQRFHAISVRESSGIRLCRDYWKVEAETHVDPTLLLRVQEWLSLSSPKGSEPSASGSVLTYLLDPDAASTSVVDRVSSGLSLPTVELLPPRPISRRAYYEDPARYAMPSVRHWLSCFAEAAYVVADSFHGCVFSIIFNKPFFVVANHSRGVARFESLLDLFDLRERLVNSAQDVGPRLLREDIDWERVNDIVERERERSLAFLRRHLEPPRHVRGITLL